MVQRYYQGFSDERRRSGERAQLDCLVKIKPRDRNAFESAIYDLSVSGFRVNCPADLHIGSAILITIPGIEKLPAKVRWKAGYEYGCAFDQSLHPAVFENIVRQSQRQ